MTTGLQVEQEAKELGLANPFFWTSVHCRNSSGYIPSTSAYQEVELWKLPSYRFAYANYIRLLTEIIYDFRTIPDCDDDSEW